MAQRRRREPEEVRPPADPEAAAREICLRQLTLAPRTRAQLAEALARKAIPEEVAELVLSRFTEVGLIDDEAFAQAWVRSRHNGKGLAPRALSAELRRRGVADETVREAVADLHPEELAEAARALVARRLPATAGLDPARRTRRLVAMLARKGYSPGLAYQVVREALADTAEDEPPFPDDP
ncbi:recombination regulator RecX [Actinocorallia sp. API 0066]|uniref:regulatory protein RecX n=1 Tax=Actinocorallia sp. API 0066 TaxID=2896846 RepID=UPI001E44F79C|nr:regulatory protein RecX [Actinocorallia sp. API 0066]MCD0453588.1 recombination regulator RecX [Actinocorallia sp. API 0066]